MMDFLGSIFARLFRVSVIIPGFLLVFFVNPCIAAPAAPARGMVVDPLPAAAARAEAAFSYRRYVALIIGISKYPDHGNMAQPAYAEIDARNLAAVLRRNYGCTEIVELYGENATRENIENELLDVLPRRLSEDDALLVFFAGSVKTIKIGNEEILSLVPYDGTMGEEGNSRNISFSRLQTDISMSLPARHVLFVIDACYGKPITRGSTASSPHTVEYLRRVGAERARQYLSAGRGGQTMPTTSGGASAFGNRLIQILAGNTDFITANELVIQLQTALLQDAARTADVLSPRIETRGRGDGDFIFAPRSASADSSAIAGAVTLDVRPGQVARSVDRRPPSIVVDKVDTRSSGDAVITGSVEDDREGVMLSANGNRVSVNSEGRFRLEYMMQSGSEVVTLVARDAAGNERKQIVNLGQAPHAASGAVMAVSGGEWEIPEGFKIAGSEVDRSTGLPMKLRNERSGYELVLVPGGPFKMGSEEGKGGGDEQPQREIQLDPYWIGVTEVTNAHFRKFRSDHRGYGDDNALFSGDEQPAVQVTWSDAKAFCSWAGMILPSEAQWEKAARGTDGRAYPWGDSFDGQRLYWKPNAAFGRSGNSKCGAFSSGISPYGCLDMAGNVAEWCADWYDATYYERAPDRNPPGPTRGTKRILRGGTWQDRPGDLRAAHRGSADPSRGFNDFGFRAAVSPEKAVK